MTIEHELDDFIALIESHPTLMCYFHNLKFDGMFITYWLLTNGYSHVSGKSSRPGTFSTLIGGTGQVYSITVKWMNGNRTEFRDSYKKLPMKASRIALSFGYDEGKGSIDYHAYRPRGYRMTPDERDYLRRDVAIVCKAIAQVHENGMKGLTIASDSLAAYKKMLPSFRDVFPVLSTAMDSEIRRAYRGGYTYADTRYQGKIVGQGIVLDVNSLYPHVMRNSPMPYGVPTFREGAPNASYDGLSIFAVTFTAKIKPDHLPCIQIKNYGEFTAAKYLTEVDEPTEFVVTNIDWQLYQDHYDIDVIEYGGVWEFKSSYGFFDEYIDHWMRVKSHSKHGIREIAKLHLNSLYGKFASNPVIQSKYPTLEDDRVKMVESATESREPVYTPAGVFITSYARNLTIRACQENYDRFLYCDTDSMHLLGFDPPAVEIHPSKLGAWKFEYEFEEGMYARPKAYLERRINGEWINKISGYPVELSAQLRFTDVYPGAEFEGKLRPRSVPGGVVLTEVPFRMKY